MARSSLAHLALLAGLWPALAGAAPQADVRKPEEVFRYTAVAEPEAIRVTWEITPGYYLYKERMSFESRTPGVELGPAVMPAGEPHRDEYFGEMHIYRDQAVVRLPLLARPPAAETLALAVRSQGCSDDGLCYPPQVWMAKVALPPAVAAEPPAGGLGALLQGNAKTGNADPDAPLPVDQAFPFQVSLKDPFTVQVRWDVHPGYYLYRHSLKLGTDSREAQLGAVDLPPGTAKFDEEFGDTQVFFDPVVLTAPLTRSRPEAITLPLVVEFQGCKDGSLCYPPQRSTVQLLLPAVSAADQATAPPASEQDRLFSVIRDGHILAVMALFAGLGLLLSFTPCCLPMYPILSGIIVGQAREGGSPAQGTARGFFLSLAYVLGMAATYTVLGAVFAAAGAQVQAIMQQPAVIIGVALLFVALALSMFGLFDLQIPASWQTRLNALSGRQKSGSLAGAAIMGMISAAVITTCVTPPLVAALTVIAKTGDVTRGALALFALGLGMGIPLLAIGASAGRLIPRAGAWMEAVKTVFGLMMLGMAVWMLDRLWPGTVTLALWAVLLVVGGVLLGALSALEPDASTGRRLGKGLALVAMLYGAALFLGALAGNEDPLRPLAWSRVAEQTRAGTQAHATGFARIKTSADLDRALAEAQAAGRPLMLDFYADWCASCKEMEKYTFPDPAVRAALADVVLLQADVTAMDAEDQALMSRFGIIGPPTILFFGPDGAEQPARRVVGFKPAADFASHARAAFRARTTT